MPSLCALAGAVAGAAGALGLHPVEHVADQPLELIERELAVAGGDIGQVLVVVIDHPVLVVKRQVMLGLGNILF